MTDDLIALHEAADKNRIRVLSLPPLNTSMPSDELARTAEWLQQMYLDSNATVLDLASGDLIPESEWRVKHSDKSGCPSCCVDYDAPSCAPRPLDLIPRKDVEGLVKAAEEARDAITAHVYCGRWRCVCASLCESGSNLTDALAAMQRPESPDNRPTEAETCPTCGGSGQESLGWYQDIGGPEHAAITCPTCHGEGSVT